MAETNRRPKFLEVLSVFLAGFYFEVWPLSVCGLSLQRSRLSARWSALLRCGFFLCDRREQTNTFNKNKLKKNPTSSWSHPPVSPVETQRQRDCCCVTRRNLISGYVCACVCASENCNSFLWHHIPLRQSYLIMIIIIVFFLADV